MQVRSIDAFNSSIFRLQKISKKDDEEGTLLTRNLNEREIFTYLNFTGNKGCVQPSKHFIVPDTWLKKELRLSNLAREMGVNTPVIDKEGRYKVNYDKADNNKNAIREGHINNVLNQFFLMDKIGLIHGDIEAGHVFYSKTTDDVELDCFRFGYLTKEDSHNTSWDFPKSYFPSNILQFENNCLGQYTEEMNKEERSNYVKGYLPLASEFHKKRADYLEATGKGTSSQAENERLKAYVYSCPDDDVIEAFADRIQMEYNQRKIFTDWDEGMGACGHKPDENRAISGAKAHFESIQAGVNYYNKVSKLQDKTQDDKKKAYFEYEKEYAKHFIDNRIEQIAGKKDEEFQGMLLWTLNPNNKVNQHHKNVPENRKIEFNSMLKNLKLASVDKISTAADFTKKYYEELLNLG